MGRRDQTLNLSMFNEGYSTTIDAEVPNLEGLNLLNHVPELPSHQYQHLIKKYNLTRLVRFMARFLPKTLDINLQKALGYGRDLLDNHSTYLKNCRTVNQLDESQELNPTLLKFAFLTLVKASSALYPPATRERTSTINGIALRCTRYDNTAMDRVFGSLFIPVISSKDTVFIKRIFE